MVDSTVSTGPAYRAPMERDYPTICPYLYYEDATALDWLVDVFGFRTRREERRPDGTLGHCELELGDSVVMVGSPEGYHRAGPGEPPRFGLYVHVDDVDAHFERVRAKGARVQGQPTDQPYGQRVYGVADLEGNQWWFAQPVAAAAGAAPR